MTARGSSNLSDRDRSRRVSRTFFFHFHAARIHPFSLRPGYTLGLGVLSAFLFLVLTVTGVLLMVYYVPSLERAYASTIRAKVCDILRGLLPASTLTTSSTPV